MRIVLCRLPLACFLVILLSQAVSGWPVQENEDESTQKKDVVEFVEQYDRNFAKKDPKLDQMLPAAQAFDERGEPFELRQTLGKYTVIVFGCLT